MLTANENGSNLPAIFTYGEKNKVAVFTVSDKPWFIAKDVCDVLKLTRTNDAVKKLDDDEKLMRKVSASGQNRTFWLVNESGLYNLIFRSNKPEARQFRKWVTNEVLPQLRQQGSYALPGEVKIKHAELVDGPEKDLINLVNKASIIAGSLHQLSHRIGVSAATLSNFTTGAYVNDPKLAVSQRMLATIELRCNQIINNTDRVERDTVEMLLKINDEKIRLGLWDKLQKGGIA